MTVALLIIDCQYSDVENYQRNCGDDWDVLEKTICGLKDYAKYNAVPVYHVALVRKQFSTPCVGRLADINKRFAVSGRNLFGGSKESFAINVDKNDIVAIKNENSANTDELRADLRNKGVTKIMLVGLWENLPRSRTPLCVTSTAVDLVKENFEVVIVSEGTNFPVSVNGLEEYSSAKRLKEFAKCGVHILPERDVRALMDEQYQRQMRTYG